MYTIAMTNTFDNITLDIIILKCVLKLHHHNCMQITYMQITDLADDRKADMA